MAEISELMRRIEELMRRRLSRADVWVVENWPEHLRAVVGQVHAFELQLDAVQDQYNRVLEQISAFLDLLDRQASPELAPIYQTLVQATVGVHDQYARLLADRHAAVREIAILDQRHRISAAMTTRNNSGQFSDPYADIPADRRVLGIRALARTYGADVGEVHPLFGGWSQILYPANMDELDLHSFSGAYAPEGRILAVASRPLERIDIPVFTRSVLIEDLDRLTSITVSAGTRLQHLHLSRCEAMREMLNSTVERIAPTLSALEIDWCPALDLSWISLCGRLTELILSSNSLQEVPEQVAGLASLELLALQNNPGIRLLPDWLTDLLRLTHLDIRCCTGVAFIPPMPALVHVRAWGCGPLEAGAQVQIDMEDAGEYDVSDIQLADNVDAS